MAFVTGNSGFPKSHDISKAIDKMAGAEREVISISNNGSGAQPSKLKNHDKGDTGIGYADGSGKTFKITAPSTEEAKEWDSWGTALKPAHEPICLARKPLIGTVAENVLEWGTGGINIGGCRVGEREKVTFTGARKGSVNAYGNYHYPKGENPLPSGRFPANFIHDGSDEVVGLFPNAGSGNNTGAYNYNGREYNNKETSMFNGDKPIAPSNYNDSGSAARFFYCAKASKKDRDEGLDDFEQKSAGSLNFRNPSASGRSEDAPSVEGMGGITQKRHNHHPTVKPTDLMQYLCRLITPPNGLIIDPFMGSGSTGKAAMYEGFRFIGIDLDPEYCKIAEARIEFALNKSNVKEEKKPKGVKSSKQTSSDNTDNSSSPLW
jgi:site-specific DNA-methyltransferase (adenine-specific)